MDNKKKKSPPIVTDAIRRLTSIPREVAAEADKRRGVTPENPDGTHSLPAEIVAAAAAHYGLEGYTVRGRGKPKTGDKS